MRRFLVTGGAGFIGSHLVAALAARGDQVRVLDDLSTGRAASLAALGKNVELTRGSILDADLLAKLADGVDCVFHHAALASVPASLAQPLATHQACATGTLLVLDAARRASVRRVVYAGSSAAYGDYPTPVKSEGDPIAVLSPYAAAKAAGELYCAAFHRSFGLETVTLRYFNVFGPRQDPAGPYAAVIPRFIARMLAGQQPTIFGDGYQTRDFCYVDNVVSANLLAADATHAAGATINIGSGTAVTLRELVARLNETLGTQLEPAFLPERTGDIRDSRADISRAVRLLGYTPQIDLREGLRRTAEYFRQSGSDA